MSARGSGNESGRKSEREKTKEYVLSRDQQKEIREAFELFDVDETGYISYHELKVALRAFGFKVTKMEACKIAHPYDPDDTGSITLDSFFDIMTEKYASRSTEDELLAAFKLFSEDTSGTITLKRLRQVVREVGEDLTDEEMRGMIDEFDRNLDGEIDLEEFKRIMEISK